MPIRLINYIHIYMYICFIYLTVFGYLIIRLGIRLAGYILIA